MTVAELALKVDLFAGRHRQLTAFLVLAGLLASFGFIRMSTRLMRSPKVSWWPGSVKTGGVHIHHLVFGIVLLMLAGFLEFAYRPQGAWLDVLAIGFGIGAGLTLDEFALWLYLDDVYWAEQGRRSVDAVIFAVLLGGLVLLGAFPISKEDTASMLTLLVALATILGFSALAAFKGKYVSAVVGVMVPLVSIVASIRLAKPGSPWARRRYAEGSGKLARAAARGERHQRRYQRLQDLIGGAPSPAEPPPEA